MKPESHSIDSKFIAVMNQERRLRQVFIKMGATSDRRRILDTPKEIYYMVWRLMEIAKSEFISRSYNSSYGLYQDKFVFESVAAHTNLMLGIVTHALDFYYGVGFGEPNVGMNVTPDGYSYRDIIEAIHLHDLPENESGDIPDNGVRDEERKNRQEFDYCYKFINTYPSDDGRFRYNALNLLKNMQEKDSITGKMLFLSDKLAALFITLCLDDLGKSPMMSINSFYASERDKEEMLLCDYSCDGRHKASEMWALDFFKMRKIVEYDDTFFFTAIIVMATLAVNGRWYNWRESEYKKN